MNVKTNQKYCAIHLAQSNITNYTASDGEHSNLSNDTQNKIEPNNPVLTKIKISEVLTKKKRLPKNQPKNTTLKEQKCSTVDNDYKENEDEIEIKFLILINEDEYSQKIAALIGPVFNDVTVSEDECDPITLDPIWTTRNQIKVPANINKYHLFSYVDSKNKVRCLTIFTMYNIIQNSQYNHPVTLEPIPEKDISRAQELIELYSTKVGLFKKQDEASQTPEFRIKNKVSALFKKFHIHSIYFEESWLTLIKNIADLEKIIIETEKLVSNNVHIISDEVDSIDVFGQAATLKNKSISKKKTKKQNNDRPTLLALQEYIVDEWNKLINAANNPQNQMPIWIIASGLSYVEPEIKKKYPHLEIM